MTGLESRYITWKTIQPCWVDTLVDETHKQVWDEEADGEETKDEILARVLAGGQGLTN
jgi:hypothetical protein